MKGGIIRETKNYTSTHTLGDKYFVTRGSNCQELEEWSTFGRTRCKMGYVNLQGLYICTDLLKPFINFTTILIICKCNPITAYQRNNINDNSP
jgi:hypothetical protein